MKNSEGIGQKVAFFLPSFKGGGAEKMLINVAGVFLNWGVDVDIVVTRSEGPYREKVPAGARVVDLGSQRMATSLPGLIGYLLRDRPSVVMPGGKGVNILAVISRAIIRGKTRLILRENNSLSNWAEETQGWRATIVPQLMHWLYPLSDGIIAISHGVKKDLSRSLGLPFNKIHVIYNPAFNIDILNKAEESLSHPWFEDDKKPVILACGRFVAQKDFVTLLHAFAAFLKKHQGRLVILGEGEDRAVLEKLIVDLDIKDYVWMPGFVANPYKYMSRADAFVLSSRWEGFGNVLVEAMAVGTPVVSTDCPSGPREILGEGRWGRLVSVGDPAAMADALFATISEETDTQALKARAQDFSVPTIAEQYFEALCPHQETRIKQNRFGKGEP